MSEKKKSFLDPIKEIPAALKTFPKGLIRLWKEPTPDSTSVAKRKTEIMPWLWFFAMFGVFFLVLGIIINAISAVTNVFWIIGAVGVLYCAFLLFINKKAAQKFKDIECDKCKYRMPYGSHVTFKEIKRTYDIKRSSNGDNKGRYGCKVTGTERVLVEITSVCPKCGTVNVFQHEFRTAVCEKFKPGVPAAQVNSTLDSFERDVRTEQENGFNGCTGTHTRGDKDIKLCIMGYFGDIIQVG